MEDKYGLSYNISRAKEILSDTLIDIEWDFISVYVAYARQSNMIMLIVE